MKRVIIAGMGPGSKSCITEEVKAAIDNAEIIVGSKRLIEEYPDKKTLVPIKRNRRLKRRRPSQVIAATVSEPVNKPIIVGPPKREMTRMRTELIAIVIKL